MYAEGSRTLAAAAGAGAEGQFLPSRLVRRLQTVSTHSATIIAAPSGYGKTTALQRLALQHPEALFLWLPTDWKDLQNGWRSSCDVLAQCDPQTGHALSNIELDEAGFLQAAALLRQINCQDTRLTFLIIDDVHMLLRWLPLSLLAALAGHHCPCLRVVVAGSGFETPDASRLSALAVNWIVRSDLAYTLEDIADRLRGLGLEVPLKQLQAILQATHGWPAAVAMHVQGVLEGKDTTAVSMDTLLGRLLFDRLMPLEQERLLAMSFYEEVSFADLCDLWDTEALTDDDHRLLLRVPLLRMNYGAGTCRLPPQLQAFLQRRLVSAPPAMRYRAYMSAGRRCARLGHLHCAVTQFYRVKNYQAIMELDLKLLSYTAFDGVQFAVIAREIVELAPMELKRAHPIALLRLAYHLYGAGDVDGYALALQQAGTFMTPDSSPALYGEWLLMSMWQHMPNLDKMHAVLRQALAYLTIPCRSIPREEPVLFGCPSIAYIFYDVPGEAEAVAQKLEAWQRDYRRAQGGECSGASQLFRAEVLAMQMNLAEAKAMAYAAMSLAQRENQLSMAYSVALLLGRIAIIKRDVPGVQAALDLLDRGLAPYQPSSGVGLYAHLHASARRLVLSAVLMADMKLNQEDLAPVETTGSSLLEQMMRYMLVLEQLNRGEVYAAIGEMEAILSREHECRTLTMLLVYQALGVARTLAGNKERAAEKFARAFAIADPDG